MQRKKGKSKEGCADPWSFAGTRPNRKQLVHTEKPCECTVVSRYYGGGASRDAFHQKRTPEDSTIRGRRKPHLELVQIHQKWSYHFDIHADRVHLYLEGPHHTRCRALPALHLPECMYLIARRSW